jgi:hypothetical protein
MNQQLLLTSAVIESVVSADPERLCENCHQPFKRREKSGGKAQRFCNPECRFAFHAQRGQRTGFHVGVSEASITPPASKESGTAGDAKPSTGVDYVRDDYEWKDDDVVLEEQKRTAVYWNIHGDVVIRQMGSDFDDDPHVVICRSNLLQFIDKLCDLAGILSGGRSE